MTLSEVRFARNTYENFPWPVRKVPLRCSPHYITFHIESKTFAVVSSLSEPTNKVWKFNGDDKELSIEDRSDRFLYPLLEKFNLQKSWTQCER